MDIDKMVNGLVLKHTSHWRIISDDAYRPKEGLFGAPLPRSGYWDWVKRYDDVDIDDGSGRGWSKPDKVIGNVELRYLWK